MPVSFFFDDMPEAIGSVVPVHQADEITTKPESLELLRHYYQMPQWLRRHIRHLVRAMAKGETTE